MKDKDFRQLVDREFAPLEWTDEQRMNMLRLMRQPERTIMRKKLIAGAAIVMALLLTSVTAFAAGVNIISIQEFLTRVSHPFDIERISVPVDESSVCVPVNQRHTSQLVDIAISQVYLAEGKLYFTTHITAKDKNTIVYTESSLPTTINGQEMRYFDLYKQEELTLLRINGLTIDWDNVADAFAPDGELKHLYSEAVSSQDGTALTLFDVYEWPEDLLINPLGHVLEATFYVDNRRTMALEKNVIFADIPQIERVDATPAAQ